MPEEKINKNEEHNSSGSHRHKSKKRKLKRKWRKFKSFVLKKRYLLINILIFVMFSLLLVLTTLKVTQNNITNEKMMNERVSKTVGLDEVYSKTFQLNVPLFMKPVVLISESAEAYMNEEDLTEAVNMIDSYRGGRLDLGKAVKLSYSVGTLPGNVSIDSSLIEVSENADISDAKSYPLAFGERSTEVFYLKTATHYYYRVTLNLSTGSSMSAVGEFDTADTPRILSVDGLANVRDIGGWKTRDGKVIKQGLLIRGTEMDGLGVETFKITSNGIRGMLTGLGILTDMDLRSDELVYDPISPLGVSVFHTVYDAPAYVNIFTDSGKESIGRIIADIADPSKYPIYIHCTHGLDRTGTVCWLIEGLLGLSDDDLLREYHLSNLYFPDVTGADLRAMINQLDSEYEGANTTEKIKNYLSSCGVTPEQMESIRNIFLEDAPASAE